MKRLLTATIAATALVGLAACSSDSKKTDSPSATDSNSGTGSGSDNGSNSGATGSQTECMALIQAMGSAAAAVGGQGDAAEWEAMATAMVAAVPDDLKGDAEIFGQAYGEFLAVIAQHEGEDNPMASADVMAALQELGTPEVQAASDAIGEYMDTNCPNG